MKNNLGTGRNITNGWLIHFILSEIHQFRLAYELNLPKLNWNKWIHLIFDYCSIQIPQLFSLLDSSPNMQDDDDYMTMRPVYRRVITQSSESQRRPLLETSDSDGYFLFSSAGVKIH